MEEAALDRHGSLQADVKFRGVGPPRDHHGREAVVGYREHLREAQIGTGRGVDGVVQVHRQLRRALDDRQRPGRHHVRPLVAHELYRAVRIVVDPGTPHIVQLGALAAAHGNEGAARVASAVKHEVGHVKRIVEPLAVHGHLLHLEVPEGFTVRVLPDVQGRAWVAVVLAAADGVSSVCAVGACHSVDVVVEAADGTGLLQRQRALGRAHRALDAEQAVGRGEGGDRGRLHLLVLLRPLMLKSMPRGLYEHPRVGLVVVVRLLAPHLYVRRHLEQGMHIRGSLLPLRVGILHAVLLGFAGSRKGRGAYASLEHRQRNKETCREKHCDSARG
mmetsp:Transcript_37588/g.97196  ORF Transcript_37588/g.97196 Transcript_37588/m.97196 type:complete len:331 (-) Transcript_37588:53-1045(-)